MSTMSGGVIRETEPSMGGGVLYEGGVVSSQHLGVLPDPRPSRGERDRVAREREQHRRHADGDRERQRLQFTKAEPKDPVSFTDIYGGAERMTLAAAHATLESFGGSVTGRADGTLAFALPRRLAPNAISDGAHRARAHEAIKVLDQCRGIVAHCLNSKRALPDLLPAAGGGVVPE